MKRTKQNILLLNKLGFECDYIRTKNEADIDWFSLSNGWGFRLDSFKNFKELILALFNHSE